MNRTVERRRVFRTSQFIIHNSYFIIQLSAFTLHPSPFFICLLGGLFLACGIQGPPHPPRLERPERVTDLTMAEKGPSFQLSFTRPLRAVDGERLTKPLEIEIVRAVTPSGGAAPPSLQGVVPWFTLSADDLAKHAAGDKVTFAAKLSEADIAASVGATFSFAVRGLTFGFHQRRLESELSNIVTGALLDVTGPVENLRVNTTEKALELSWAAPARSLTGNPPSDLAGFRVYRSPTGKPGTFQVRSEPTSPAYSDSEFAFDQTYFYKVCARFQRGAQEAESEDSAVAEITPRDTFPPAAPRNVSGLFSADAAQLVWSANTEADLAGYNVYRREGNGGWQKINPDLLRTPTFEDRAVQPGHQYFYRVTAIDLAHNESTPSEEVTVETR